MSRDPRELNSAWRRFQHHAYPAPSPALAVHVDRFWVVSWDYTEPYRQKIVPYPNVHLTFSDDDGAMVHGVSSRHQTKVLEGRGGRFGVAFRPGAFRPFLGASVSTITDRSIPAAEVFGGALPDPVEVATVEEFLMAHLPEPDPRTSEASDASDAVAIVERIIAKPDLTRVDAVAAEAGLSVRGLQRLFAEHVGVGPKWVIRRYRLHEVTERLAKGAEIEWAALAADLGYADQAHFVRDFRAMFGESPTWYAQRY